MAKEVLQANEEVLEELERTKWKRTFQTIAKDWRLYILLVPMLLFLILYKYRPILGIFQGFKRSYAQANLDQEWAGLKNVQTLLSGNDQSAEFWRALRNTFVNSMYGLVFGFPIPIFLALLFSEVKSEGYRSILQVCSYLPHFVSTVVTTSIILKWSQGATGLGAAGILYQMFNNAGWIISADGNVKSVMDIPRYFRPIFQVSGVWEGAGYGSIVYFAAVMAISPTNYEAAKIDGASKMQQIKYVTLPGMAPTLTIMLIMRIGHILNIGYEKVILLSEGNRGNWSTAEVISSLVYKYSGRSSLTEYSGNQELGIIMDLFNAIIAMCLVLGANTISRRVSDTSLF